MSTRIYKVLSAFTEEVDKENSYNTDMLIIENKRLDYLRDSPNVKFKKTQKIRDMTTGESVDVDLAFYTGEGKVLSFLTKHNDGVWDTVITSENELGEKEQAVLAEFFGGENKAVEFEVKRLELDPGQIIEEQKKSIFGAIGRLFSDEEKHAAPTQESIQPKG